MTQNTTHVLLILLGGFVGGLAGSALMGGSPDTPEPMISVDAGQAGMNDLSVELVDRLQNVEGSMAGLRATLDDMRAQLADRRREPLPPVDIRNAQGGDSRRATRGSSANFGPSGELEERFSDFLEEREVQKAEERLEQEADRRAQRVERRIERYAERLGLNDYQSQEMARIMTNADQKRSAYFVELRESGDFDRTAVREAMHEMSAGTNDELAQLLDSDQMSEYESMQSESRGGWGGGRGNDHGGNSRGGNSRGGNGNEF